MLLSILGLIFWRLNFGIDFKGGSLVELNFGESNVSLSDVQSVLKDFNLGEITMQKSGSDTFVFRLSEINEDTHQKIIEALRARFNNVEEKSFQTIGPAIGGELKNRAIYATFFALLGILIYISFAFRKVSYPVASFKYALAAVFALFHDVLITLGVFAVLGKFYGVEVGLPFVAAILTVLGYSVNDTIVVFDRIRENLFSVKGGSGGKKVGSEFENIINISLNQTLRRSVFTSLTVLLALLILFLFGGFAIRYFVLALLIGIGVGTYSSIFIASTLLVVWESRKK